jgi:hypothetical protein
MHPDVTSTFVIDNHGETREIQVSTAEITFLQDQESWLIGIHVSGFDATSEFVPLHLIDYRIHGSVHPRERGSLEIHIPEGDDGLHDRLTNLCTDTHTATDNNHIRIAYRDDRRYLVQWSGVGEECGSRFNVNVLATEVYSILYP